MEKSIFLAGSGGHGIQVVGKTVVQAADTEKEKVTYSPRYGVEKRGGLSSCYIVISDEMIGNPRKTKNDVVIVMDEKSFLQFKDSVKQGGTLILNSTMISDTERTGEDCHILKLPLMQEAQALGNPKVISSILLGVLAGLPGIIESPQRLKEHMLKILSKKPELLKLNEKAFDTGMRLVQTEQTEEETYES